LTANLVDATDACQLCEPGNDVLVSHGDLDSRPPFTYEAAFSFEYAGKPGSFSRRYVAWCNWCPISAPGTHGGLEVHRPAANWARNVLIPCRVAGDAVPRPVRAAA